jgi:2-oxoglutarate ferredoxin oxidoreductase subunit gamma
MALIKQFRFCGFGGQGIVLIGTILSHAAVKNGKWIAGTNAYGAAARGGDCRADVVISNEQIVYPYIIESDALVAMFQPGYDKYIKSNKANGLVIFDGQFVTQFKKDSTIKHIEIPATNTAIKELNRKEVANMIILGATVELTGVVSKDALSSAIQEDVPERFKDLNLKAIEIGYRLAREVGNSNSDGG